MSEKRDTTNDYLMKNFPPDLKAAARHRAIDEGCSLRELILKVLSRYLKQKQRVEEKKKP